MSPLPSSLDALRRAALPLRGADSDLDPLLQRIGDASVVPLGEGSHAGYRVMGAAVYLALFE